MMNEDFFLGFYWKEDFCSTEQYLTNVHTFINQLKKIIPELKTVEYVSSKDTRLIPDEIHKFKDLLLPYLQNNEAWYFDPKGNRSAKIAFNTISDSGFFTEFLFSSKDSFIQVTISAGMHTTISPEGEKYGDNIPNSIVVSFSENHSLLKDSLFLQNILQSGIDCFNPYFASLCSHEFIDHIIDENTDLYTGWITYVKKDPIDLAFLPDKFKKVVYKNGTFIITDSSLPLTSNSHQLEKQLSFFNLMKDQNLLNWK